MQLSADDVVTTLHAEDGLVLSLADADLALAATVELDIRDAPVREALIETDRRGSSPRSPGRTSPTTTSATRPACARCA